MKLLKTTKKRGQEITHNYCNFMEDFNDDTFKNEIKNWINVDSFLRAQAVDVAMGGWDGLYMVANNHYLYYDEDT